MSEKAEKVLEYIERSFTDPSFKSIMDEDLEIVSSRKMPEQYIAVSDVFKAITQFTDALTAKGRESFTPIELQLTLFTLIADMVVDTDVAPVVHAEWRYVGSNWECSNCLFPVYSKSKFYRYCPQCGARMDGGVENA